MSVDENDPKQVVEQVGASLRKLRKEKRLSLEELSKQTGVSKLTLGNLERGETNPTLGVMWKISKGLSVPLMALFSADTEVTVSRAGQGLRIVGEQKTWAIEPIFQNAKFGTYEMYRAYLQPNSEYHPEGHHLSTTEIATVMSGAVTIAVNEETYNLQQFDSISFRSDGTHVYINRSDETAVLHILLKYEIGS